MPLALSRSLRGRLLLLVALVGASLVALATLLIWRAYENERDAVSRELANTARATASLVEQRVENMEALLAGLVAAGDLASEDLDEFEARARQFTKLHQRWFVVTTLDGQQLVNTAAPAGSSLPVTPPEDGELAAVVAGRAFVSNVFEGPVTKRPVFYLSLGVPSGPRPRYIVSIATSPQEFAGGTFMEAASEGYVFTVIDRSGHILTRSVGAQTFVGRSPTPDIAAAARTGREAFLRSRTLEGIDVLGVVVPVPRFGWAIAAGAPVTKLKKSADRLIFTGALTCLLILAAATAVAWWISRAALRDVDGLLADTRGIASGESPPPSGAKLAETRAIAASIRETHRQLQEQLHERKQAEAALVLAKSDLEKKVAERTASLTELLGQMEEFNYCVAHDLRAPLRHIVGFSRVVLEDHGEALDATGRGYLQRVAEAGERMDRLIEDLLTLSRVGRQDLELGPVALGPLMRDCVREHPVLAEQSARIEIEEPLPRVVGHLAPLQQALANLLTNALKFVRHGVEPRVRVHAARHGAFVRLWVEDNGIGIAPDHQGRLFNIFQRVHPQQRYAGTGIGLAIVRRAVERLGGRVGVESEEGRGSRFWIDLRPAEDAADPGPSR